MFSDLLSSDEFDEQLYIYLEKKNYIYVKLRETNGKEATR